MHEEGRLTDEEFAVRRRALWARSGGYRRGPSASTASCTVSKTRSAADRLDHPGPAPEFEDRGLDRARATRSPAAPARARARSGSRPPSVSVCETASASMTRRAPGPSAASTRALDPVAEPVRIGEEERPVETHDERSRASPRVRRGARRRGTRPIRVLAEQDADPGSEARPISSRSESADADHDPGDDPEEEDSGHRGDEEDPVGAIDPVVALLSANVIRPTIASITTAPSAAAGSSSKRLARNSIVSSTIAALISEAICVRCPAASATGRLREAAVVDEPAGEARGAAGDALRDQLLVGVDLVAVLRETSAARRQRLRVADEDRPRARRRRACRLAPRRRPAARPRRARSERSPVIATPSPARSRRRGGAGARDDDHDQRPRPPRARIAHREQQRQRTRPPTASVVR